jgi:site-specific recombinase XerD
MQSYSDAYPLGDTMTGWNDARLHRAEITGNTHRGSRWAIARIVEHFGAGTPLDAVTADDIEDWLVLLDGVIAPRSRNTMCSTYRRFWADACRRRWTTTNPMHGIRNARVADEPAEPVPARHVTAILAEAGLYARTLITVDAHLGLRRTELARIRIEDYDPAAGTLLVRNTKGGRYRTVPVEREAAWALDRWLDHRRTAAGAGERLDVGWVFPGRRHGHPISGSTVYRLMTEASHAVGLHHSPHRYRHTTATTMILAGAPVETVRRHLGHAHLSTTGRYTHALVEDIRPHVATVVYDPAYRVTVEPPQ